MAFNNVEIEERAVVDNLESCGVMMRADMIDFKTWDVQLEKHLNRAWSKTNSEARTKPEDWEIDLSKLDIKKAIAYGTYGTVYKGVYDAQDVAVKVLEWGEDGMTTAAESDALQASFKQEVAVWHKLDHPNVTKFIGASVGTTNLKLPSEGTLAATFNSLPSRACCVVVEYIPGGTLNKFLINNSKKKLAFRTVVQLALDLARGLSYLHSKKIVHRDVKTENMLIDAYRNLKIADFGVARVEAQNPRDMTGNTGTLGYMAPEDEPTLTILKSRTGNRKSALPIVSLQISGCQIRLFPTGKVLDGKPYNRKCDVYSFGICLWEIYCCSKPYNNLSFAEVSGAVVQQNLRPEIPRCCPTAFANIMRICWNAKPESRPEMEEVVKMLEAVDTSKGGGMIPDDQASGCFCFRTTYGS